MQIATNGVPPDPISYDFGSLKTFTSSAPQVFTVTNVGTYVFTDFYAESAGMLRAVTGWDVSAEELLESRAALLPAACLPAVHEVASGEPARVILERLQLSVGSELVRAILDNPQDSEPEIREQRRTEDLQLYLRYGLMVLALGALFSLRVVSRRASG